MKVTICVNLAGALSSWSFVEWPILPIQQNCTNVARTFASLSLKTCLTYFPNWWKLADWCRSVNYPAFLIVANSTLAKSGIPTQTRRIMVTSILQISANKMPAILALRVMLGLIHLFQLYASLIDKTILANGIVWVTTIALRCFPCVTRLRLSAEICEMPLR